MVRRLVCRHGFVNDFSCANGVGLPGCIFSFSSTTSEDQVDISGWYSALEQSTRKLIDPANQRDLSGTGVPWNVSAWHLLQEWKIYEWSSDDPTVKIPVKMGISKWNYNTDGIQQCVKIYSSSSETTSFHLLKCQMKQSGFEYLSSTITHAGFSSHFSDVKFELP